MSPRLCCWYAEVAIVAAPWRIRSRLGGVPLPARKFGGEMRGTAQTASEHDWQSSARPRLARPRQPCRNSVAEDEIARLDDREAAERVRQAGSNVLPAPAAASALRRLLQQFDNVLIYVLLAAAAVTSALGHRVDTGVILGVVGINAILGFVQEGGPPRPWRRWPT